ncbi:hypothetical protein PhCBS80983_g00533 [Powellomyces hirtus]|uniref:Transmembrane protein n=1 Tax=Powellomyces hirtus TaxID=109895 RepID=A0A507EDN5_9FUNG|nr:hypothetical protein PhCBS80983_g00533 [Powellomyces hirtus]
MVFLEKQILDHLGYWIQTSKHQLSPEEKECVKFYDKSPIYFGIANFAVWGSLAYYTLDFRAFFNPNANTTASPPPTQAPVKQMVSAQPLSRTPKFTPAVRPVMPAWITLWGIAAISAGAFASTYYTSKWAARQCLQCFIDMEDKKSQLYLATRQLLKEHNADAEQYFKIEKHRLKRIE